MSEKSKLKTTTIGTLDNPLYSVCDGHVDEKTFTEAMEAEGWEPDVDGCGDLKHAYYYVNSDGGYIIEDKEAPGLKPCTITEW